MKTIALRNLNLGEEFDIPSIGLKGYTVLRSTESSVLVVRGSDRDYFAASTQVVPVGITHKLIHKKSGIPDLQKAATEEQKRTIKLCRGDGRKGRRPNNSNVFEWPLEEFTFKELADKLEVEYHVVANAFNRERQNFHKVREIPNARGRGKPISVWKKLNK